MVYAFLFWKAGSQSHGGKSELCKAWHWLISCSTLLEIMGVKAVKKHQNYLMISVLTTFHTMLVHYHMSHAKVTGKAQLHLWCQQHGFTTCQESTSGKLLVMAWDHQKAHTLRLGVFVGTWDLCMCKKEERNWKPILLIVICAVHRGGRFLVSLSSQSYQFAFSGLVWRHLLAMLYVYIQADQFLGHLCIESATACRHPYIDIL